MTYTPEEIDAAITRVETLKQNHPRGWAWMRGLRLPVELVVAYIFTNADLHLARLDRERDHRVLYSAGWLQGLAVGVALGENQGVEGVEVDRVGERRADQQPQHEPDQPPGRGPFPSQ